MVDHSLAPDEPLGEQRRDPKTALSAFKVLKDRFAPDAPLGEPKMKYEDTFSAETVILETFFPKSA